MKKNKSLISVVLINLYLFSNISIACSRDFSIPNSNLSPQLVLNAVDIQNLFLNLRPDNPVIIITATPADEMPKNYKQKINPEFFVKVIVDWCKAQANLIGIGPAFYVFGSARFKTVHYWYEQARRFGRMAGEAGISIITGGGGGIMLAANQGAAGIKGVNSVGLGMKLPHEKNVDHYEYKNLVNIFEIFFTRKLMFIEHSLGGVTMPGGFGSLDEIFEVLAFNLRYPDMAIPNVLLDNKFYGGLMEILYQIHFQGLMPLPEDLLLTIKDTTEEAFKHLQQTALKQKSSIDINLKVFIPELMSASRLLNRIGPAVSIIGGSSTQQESIYWSMARDLAGSLNDLNFNIIRRGNKGIAGAIGQAYSLLDRTNDSVSRGLFIALHEDGKGLNENYADKSLHFDYYFSLKLALIEHSKFGMIVFPGGVDTLDVLFETLCLVKTDKISPVPIVLIGRDFWLPLIEWIKQTMIPEGTINASYLDLIYIVDSEVEAQQIILEHVVMLKKTIEYSKIDQKDSDVWEKVRERKLRITIESIMSKAMTDNFLQNSNKFCNDFIGQAI